MLIGVFRTEVTLQWSIQRTLSLPAGGQSEKRSRTYGHLIKDQNWMRENYQNLHFVLFLGSKFGTISKILYFISNLLYIYCSPKKLFQISSLTKKTKCEFWVVFRSERPVSPIFPLYVMSNKTYGRMKKLRFPPFKQAQVSLRSRLIFQENFKQAHNPRSCVSLELQPNLRKELKA